MIKVIAPLLVLLALAAFFLIFQNPFDKFPTGDLKLASPAFENNAPIPINYTCDGKNVNPVLEISGVSKSAKSLVLILEDPDASSGTWVHWIIYNLPPETTLIPENPPLGLLGVNSGKTKSYAGPCPPPGETHHYNFNLYVLDTVPVFSPLNPITKEVIEEKIKNRIIESTVLTGTYQR